MENKTKAQTFLGFCIRSNKYRVGLNSLKTLKKISLVIICESTQKSTREKAMSIAKKFNCKALSTNGVLLENMIYKENAKVMAVTDDALAKAILDNLEPDFKIAQEEKING